MLSFLAFSRKQLSVLGSLLTASLLASVCLSASEPLPFPPPAAVSVCPAFSRYTRLHRAALGLRPKALHAPFKHHALQQDKHLRSHYRYPDSAGLIPARSSIARLRYQHHRRRDAKAHRRLALDLPRSASTATSIGYSYDTPTHYRWVVTADRDGLADRLVNAVSSFYFALLTDRVLCIQPHSAAQPGLEATLDHPNIDWTCGGLGPADSDPAVGGSSGGSRKGPPLQGPDVAFWDATADDAWMDPRYPVYHTFVRSDLNTVGPANATTILLRMHRGLSVAMFNNPHHRVRLEALGLRPDTAFGCALQFLFGPSVLNAEAQALAEADPELHGLMLDESAIKIGIQIRLGDDNILAQIEQQGEAPLNEQSSRVVGGFLDCAAQLADSVREAMGPLGAAGLTAAKVVAKDGTDRPVAPPTTPPPPPVGPPLRIYFFLMTDTLAARRLAREKFGSQLLTLDAAQVQFFRNVTEDGLRRTALEHWYFSRCHHHVITELSGMGRTAAFASLRPGPSVFSMQLDDGARLWGRACTVWDADRPFDVYSSWSGV